MARAIAQRQGNDRIAAIGTPSGRGGIGVVRVSGDSLSDFAKEITGRCLIPRQATFCRFLSADGQAIDAGLALYFPAPHSFTGEDVIELQGHGGPVVLSLLLARCVELGARVARPGEFSERGFLNGKMDLAQAEAVADLIDAQTEAAAKSAVRSLQGEFSRAVRETADQLVALRALIEALLDFPEEELDIEATYDVSSRLDEVCSQLNRVFDRARRGNLLRAGMHVVLVGQPNVGKSSLLNRIAEDDLAIVAEIPGTTRDSLRAAIQIRGIPLHLTDTAGLRKTSDPVERLGIERSWREINRADLILLIADACSGATAEDIEIIRQLPVNASRLTVFNKSDLAGISSHIESTPDGVSIYVSALTGDGVMLLEEKILEQAGWRGAEDVILARSRHLDALERSSSHLRLAAAEIERMEIFAEELRFAHRALMEITGEFTSEDLLGSIFSSFCIGK